MDGQQPNRGSPHILRLPTELVTLIWFLFIHDVDPNPMCNGTIVTPGWAYHLSSVCRRWHQIALATPWLWAEYVVGRRFGQFAVLPRLLSRSNRTPLVIELIAVYLNDDSELPTVNRRWHHPAQQSTWKPGLDAILAHMDHVRKLRLEVRNPEDLHLLLTYFTRTPAPMLDTFEVSIPDHLKGPEMDLGAFFPGSDVPTIRHFDLSITPKDWSAPIFGAAREFTFYQRHRRMYPRVQLSRSRTPYRYLTPGDIADLLQTAPQLEKLYVREGYMGSAPLHNRLRQPKAVHLQRVYITADCSETAMFTQLVEVLPMPVIRDLLLLSVPSSGVEYLWTHLEGPIDCVLWTERPTVVLTDWTKLIYPDWVRNEEYEYGTWHFVCFDGRDFKREFTLGDEHLLQAQMLRASCSVGMQSVRRLRVNAAQWWQVSRALASLDLRNVEEFVLRIVVDKILPYENNAEMDAFWLAVMDGRGPSHPPHVLPLHGLAISLPSLSHLSLCGEVWHPLAGQFVPMSLTSEVYTSILTMLGVTGTLEQVYLRRICPADDDARSSIQVSTRSIIFSDGNYPSVPKSQWWRTADLYHGAF